MNRFLLALTSLLLAAPLLLPTAPTPIQLPTADAPWLVDETPFDEATRLLKAGQLDEAYAAGQTALASHPYSVDGYLVMYEIAKAREDVGDMLRWVKWVYWSYKYNGQTKKLDEVLPLAEGMWEGWNLDDAILETWEKQVRQGAKKAGSSKHFRLAGHLLDRLLMLNPSDTKLEKDYDKLADKAGNQLSGGAFVAASIRRKSPKWLMRENKKHEHWENPFERKTKHYELNTNVSWEFAETLSAAMDEINEFYRQVYDYRKKARAKIHVMRKRSDFDRMALKVLGRPMPSLGVGGYWVETLKTVVAYDRSFDEEGLGKSALWKTLFHEASHQFMSLLTRGRHLPPTWLDEGTSSYFEGCQIKADGTIVKNAPALGRLREWWHFEHSDSRHTLEQLIAHDRNLGPDGSGTLSYEVDYYCYGWALVYFLLNYEENDRRVYGQAVTDDGRGIPAEYKVVRKAGKLVYRDAYRKYLEHFTERGCKGDKYYALEIAKELFVDEVADPDVPDWDAFEARWRKFTTSLWHEEQAGQELADVLQARCRGYMLADDYERARITIERADDKRPNDAETYRLLALSNAGEGRGGDALYWMIRHWEMVWPAGDQDAATAAEEWLADNDGKDVLKLYIEPTRLAVVELESACKTALEANQPLAAMLFAGHGTEVMAMDHHALMKHLGVGIEPGETAASELAETDLRMWQRAYEKGEDGNRTYRSPELTVNLVSYEADGVLINNPEGGGRPGVERVGRRSLDNLAPPFEIRGKVQVDGNGAVLLLGIDHGGLAKVVFTFFNRGDDQAVRLSTLRIKTDIDSGNAFRMFNQVGGFAYPTQDQMEFEIVVSGDEPSYMRFNGSEKLALPEEFTPELLNGSIGLDVDDGTVALWSNIEVRPSRPFWPVQ